MAITAEKLAANSVTASAIAAGAVEAIHIKAGSISADKIALGIDGNMVADPSFEGEATPEARRGKRRLERDQPGQGHPQGPACRLRGAHVDGPNPHPWDVRRDARHAPVDGHRLPGQRGLGGKERDPVCPLGGRFGRAVSALRALVRLVGWTGRDRTHGHAARPAAFSADGQAQMVSWRRNEGKWIDVTSQVRDVRPRGFALEPNHTSSSVYGRAHGVGQQFPPQLKVTYVK
ncbi:hypothetical protein [Streptomyces sp. NPDC048606]|uniref:hypothetical protein n=1 Tax=Streptomyces sp. NPDC048606 TaxID=3154726 RepID=UPI003426C910